MDVILALAMFLAWLGSALVTVHLWENRAMVRACNGKQHLFRSPQYALAVVGAPVNAVLAAVMGGWVLCCLCVASAALWMARNAQESGYVAFTPILKAFMGR